MPRISALYILVDGKLTISNDVQAQAMARYALKSNEVFLGRIDNNIFYWKGFDPSRVFWHAKDSSTVFSIELTKAVIDIYGATRGVKKDIGFVVFRKSPGFFHYSPYTDEFVEISLAKGKIARVP